MSETAQGPGWWQASDGRWYPPEAAPGAPPSTYDVLPAGPPIGAPVPNAGKATATLVLGILAFFTCPVVAIAALIVGAQANRQIRESYGRLGGESLVKTGRILAIVNLGFAVLMVPVMVAIAIPTFLGARERAQDRVSQSALRNALTAEKVLYTDNQRWTDDPTALAGIEPSLRYEPGTTPVAESVVYVAVQEQLLGLSSRSRSGTCFYVLEQGVQEPRFAEDEHCGPIQDQRFGIGWN
jgi:type IV pilus assembly protein PilA